MTHILGFAGLLLTAAVGADDSAASTNPTASIIQTSSRLHVVASTYGALGRYSTDTRSRSLSGYVTLSNSWRDFYTAGYATLLERDDARGTYYTQHFASLRASWLFGLRVNLAVHYAYLDAGEIAFDSNPAVFHYFGAGVSYWFSPGSVAGSSFTLSASGGRVQAGAYRGYYSFEVARGIWLNSMVAVTKAQWTPTLFSVRELLSVQIGTEDYITLSAAFGRRAFYFDDENLLAYNQRAVQTGNYSIKGTIGVTSFLYLIPALEHGVHDDYRVTYGSLGVRAVF